MGGFGSKRKTTKQILRENKRYVRVSSSFIFCSLSPYTHTHTIHM